MRLRLQRLSLIDQLCAALRDGLARGEWPDWLPSERRLGADLRVGRNSLRAALRRLAEEGVIEIVPGQGTRNSGGLRTPSDPDRTAVGLLAPIPLEQLRPRQALWIDELRGILAENGSILRYVHGPQYARKNPAPALQRMVAQERCRCWILVRSTEACQAWFARRAVPCVIAGSCHPGVSLPSVDLDYRAMCRHAATTLLQLGHRRIAYLTPVSAAAGDLRSEEGFLEGARAFPRKDIQGSVVRHGADKADVALGVRRLLQSERPPTALLINNSYHYLTAFSVLVEMGRRIPQDVSLVCRDEDRFLSFLEPEPARYVEDPRQFARTLARLTTIPRRERSAPVPQTLLLPQLRRGASIARASA